MYDRNTIRETDDYERWEELRDKTKVMQDHQFEILVRCATCPDDDHASVLTPGVVSVPLRSLCSTGSAAAVYVV